jgi:hypothetical protein
MKPGSLVDGYRCFWRIYYLPLEGKIELRQEYLWLYNVIIIHTIPGKDKIEDYLKTYTASPWNIDQQYPLNVTEQHMNAQR